MPAPGANQRVQKAVYWLTEARAAGQKPDKVMDAALGLVLERAQGSYVLFLGSPPSGRCSC